MIETSKLSISEPLPCLCSAECDNYSQTKYSGKLKMTPKWRSFMLSSVLSSHKPSNLNMYPQHASVKRNIC